METMANPHTAEELAQLSTLVHKIAGVLLLVIAGGIIVETMRGMATGRWRYAWPALGVFVGLGLTAWVVLHMIFTHRVSPFAVPAQVQHQVIGLFAGVGSLVELVRRKKGRDGRAWRAAFPIGLIGVGVAFVVHEQGTTEALLVHWALAGTVIFAGMALLAAALSGEAAKAVTLLGALLLAGAAAQLVAYRESPGAHGEHGAPPAKDPFRHGK